MKRKDYEQYSKLRTSIGQYETKLAEIKDQIAQSLAKKEQLDGEMREIERDLHKIQGIESEYTYLQLSLTEKTRQAQEYSERLRFEDANSKESMLTRERELLKMKDNYD